MWVGAQGATLFLVSASVAPFGMVVGNVVGPPGVKRYFPDRRGVAMTLWVLTTQAGATIPVMLAVPVAAAARWRVSVGAWAELTSLAALPWISAIVKDRGSKSAQQTSAAPAATRYGVSELLRNGISLGAALFYGMAALNTYGWRVPLLVFAAMAVPVARGAVMLTRRVQFEDLASSH